MLDLIQDIQREMGLSNDENKVVQLQRKNLLETFANIRANESMPVWYRNLYRIKRRLVK